MSEYLIESPHTKQECLQVLDDTLALGKGALSKFQWGCGSGDHTAWAFVKTNSESRAKEFVPARVRNKAKVVKVGKLSPKQIESYHNM
jgi:hypothetical protein